MAHNSYIRAGAIWTPGTPVDPSEWQKLDIAQFKSINGDDGGTWAPASPIVIGGQGLQLGGTNPTWTPVTPLIIDGDGLKVTGTPTTGGLDAQLSPNTWIKFAETTRTFARRIPILPAAETYANGTAAGFGFVQGGGGAPPNNQIATVLLPLPQGATLTNIRTRFKVKSTHASLPTLGPGLSCYLINPASVSTAGTVFLNSADAGDGQELKYALPGTVAAYNAAGDTYFDYPVDQHGTVDNTTNFIVATIFDESGGGVIAGNIFTSLELTFTMTDWQVP